MFIYFLLLSVFIHTAFAGYFERVKNDTFQIKGCVPFAFADFDANNVIDIYCVSNEGKVIEVYSYFVKKKITSKLASFMMSDNKKVTDLIAADFDADSMVDLAVFYQESSEKNLRLAFIWGDNKNLTLWNSTPHTFTNVPTVVNVHPEKMELLGTVNGSKFGFLHVEQNRSLSFLPFGSEVQLRDLSTVAYLDLTADFKPDIFLTTMIGKNPRFEIWSYNNSTFSMVVNYGPPSDVENFFLSIFVDIDATGYPKHLLPACRDRNCNDPVVYAYINNSWVDLNVNFTQCTFVEHKITGWWGKSPFGFRISDFNLDGYPDLLAIMKCPQRQQVVVLFENIPSPATGRTFKLKMDETELMKEQSVTAAGFFDIFENGYPDLILSISDKTHGYKLIGFENKLEEDVYFFKVMVIGGGCRRIKCPYSSLPFGDNHPGSSVRLEISRNTRETSILYGAQMSQTSHFILQLPYITFGLGIIPNFVEKLQLSAPTSTEYPVYREWVQLIPNSQVIVITYPSETPSSWLLKLYITPSKLIIYTGIALIITCALLTLVILILQIREKRADDAEHKLESRKFRYNAL